MIKIVFKHRCKKCTKLVLFSHGYQYRWLVSNREGEGLFFSATSGDLKRQDHQDNEVVSELSLFGMAFDWPYSEIRITSIT